jgi:pyruvate, water dikinase
MMFRGAAFSKKNVCMPLINVTGTHVAKYRFFRTLLSHNHAALESLAVMEQQYYNGRPFSLASVRINYEELLEAVFGVIYSLEALTGRKSAVLEHIVDETDKMITTDFMPKCGYQTSDIVLPFDDITQDMKPMVGSKAANLALIRNNLKLPVPEGFAVTAYAFGRFMKENSLLGPIARELSGISSDSLGEIENASSAIQSMILRASVPDDIKGPLLDAYHGLEAKSRKGVLIAMRSSAIGEDTEATFAGQYTTVLNVAEENILDAYKTVIAGKYSAKAISYRMRYGLADSETPMCVAGLVMLSPRSSGVIYTRNYVSDSADAMKITSLWGLAEQLVDGSASSDMFTMDRKTRTVIKRDIIRKDNRLLPVPGGGVRLEQVPDDEQEISSLDDTAIMALCHYGLMLEEYFGGPQDIEWAMDKTGDLFIIQSRPLNMPPSPAYHYAGPIDLTKHQLLISGGRTASSGIAVGRVFNSTGNPDLTGLAGDEILVARTASPDYARVIGKVRGIITDTGSPASHLASVAREFSVPALFGMQNATSLLAHGEIVTLAADTSTVYKGIVGELVNDIRPIKQTIFESPVHRKLRGLLDRLAPLNLTDPQNPSFSPEGCETFHDIIRFTHEHGMKAMFGLTDETDEVRSIRLTAKIPLTLNLIDLGGGLKEGLTTCHEVTPEHIESYPMRAIWKGFTHPGITWSGAISITARNLMTLFASSVVPEFGEMPGGISYVIMTKEYANLSVKFGYHFATIDALCSDDSNQNYVSLGFAGGAGNYYGKALRVAFLGSVLSKLGFKVSLKGDLLEAFVSGYSRPAVEDKLDQLGRLLAASRLLDMALSGQNDVDTLTESFFNGEYDFLSNRKEDDLKEFYTNGGYWKRIVEDGHVYCVQDSSKDYPIASGAAGTAGKFVGQKVQELLDNIEAYYYFPLAIAKSSEISDGKVSVRIKPIKGHIDRAGGIAFGIQNSSNYYVLRINALEDNIILFEYVNSKRYQRVALNEKISSSTWYELSVEILGNSIRGYLDGTPVIEYTADKQVQGFIGLWTKADSVTCFDALILETNAQKKIITF